MSNSSDPALLRGRSEQSADSALITQGYFSMTDLSTKRQIGPLLLRVGTVSCDTPPGQISTIVQLLVLLEVSNLVSPFADKEYNLFR